MIASLVMDVNEIKNLAIYLKLSGKTILSIRGTSMEPALRDGDQVQIELVKAHNLKVGDIIIFERDVLSCHRILGRFKKDGKFYFWEKGDNSNNLGYICEDMIIGRVRRFIKDGKFRRPNFYLDRYIIFFYPLEAIMYPYIKASYFIKKYLFKGNKNVISHLFGNLAWKTYYFYINFIKKIKFG